jgi:zinc protease
MKRGAEYGVRGARAKIDLFFPHPAPRTPRLLLAFIFLLLLAAVPARAAVFHPKTFTLANGLQFVVVQNRLSPAIAQMVWYKVGSADEAPGASGLAHYLEHLMFRGTEAIPAGAFSPLIAAQGGNDNAFTSYDYTAFHEVVASDRLAMIMQMEADRMQNLRITPETATPELSVVLDERQERTDNNPQGKFEERLGQVLFPGHPYGIPVIGWKAEMEKMTPEAAAAFYRHHYAPDNAVVVISGNVDMAEVMRLAAGTFGRVPKRDVSPRRVFLALKPPRETRVVMVDARVQQPHLEIHIVGPSRATEKDHESYAFEVLSEALAGGEVGVLYKQLVMKQQVAGSLDISYDPDARGPAPFVFIATPQAGRTIDELEKALNESLHHLARKGLSAVDVNAAKKRLRRSAVFARDSLLAPGYVFGSALTTGQKVADVEDWPERIKAVTAAEVNAALRRLVASKYRVTGLLLPDPNATPEERAKAQNTAPSHEMGIR